MRGIELTLILAAARAEALGFAVVRLRADCPARWLDLRLDSTGGLLVTRSHGVAFSQYDAVSADDLLAKTTGLIANGWRIDKTW